MARGRIRSVIALGCLSACIPVRVADSSPPANALVVEAVADDHAQVFSIAIHNASGLEVCVEATVLPNALGLWAGENGRYVLYMPGSVLQPPLGMEGDCVGLRCEIHLTPRRTLHVQLAYRAFGDAELVSRAAEKRLVIDLPYYRCGQ